VRELAARLGTEAIPLGEVIAVAELVGVLPVERCSPSLQEQSLGDFSPGRWAWAIRRPRLIAPQDAHGTLGLWRWQPEREIVYLDRDVHGSAI